MGAAIGLLYRVMWLLYKSLYRFMSCRMLHSGHSYLENLSHYRNKECSPQTEAVYRVKTHSRICVDRIYLKR